MQEIRGYILIIISMLIWGSVGIFGRLIEEPSTVIVFYRVILAFIILFVLWIFNGSVGLSKLRTNWKLAVGSGLALGLNWYFFFTAIQRTTVAKAVLSYYTAPIIVTILSPLLLKEKIEKQTLIALIIGFGGIVVMMTGSGGGFSLEDLSGIGAGLMAAFLYALLTISGKLVDLPIRLLVLIQTGVSGIIFLPYVVNRPLPDFDNMVLLIIIGVVHTALALSLYFTALKWVKVQHVGILGYLDPLSAIIYALLFFGEIPQMASVAGGILILSSSYLVMRKPGHN